ncbi:MAG: hypothetical protein A2Z77_00585 [Chloroflexi bacterium RBG_13_51_36]|nr:MAG: hypothetical protein A2Z77_00585 [Chloroflexi bacterium RBG_13_51_36]
MLHEPSKKRLVPDDCAQHLLKHFENLVNDAIEMDCPCLDLVVTYIDKDDKFVQGTYVPELHLIVRRVDDYPNIERGTE